MRRPPGWRPDRGRAPSCASHRLTLVYSRQCCAHHLSHLMRKALAESLVAEMCRKALPPGLAELFGAFARYVENSLQKLLGVGGIDRTTGEAICHDFAARVV